MQATDADIRGPLAGARWSATPSTGNAFHEVLSLVMPHLTHKDRANVSRVSRKWREIAVEQHLWRTVDAGDIYLTGWDSLCRWAHACNTNALKASLVFYPGYYELMDMFCDEEVFDGPIRLARLLSAAQCTSLTSLHLCIDTSDVDDENLDYMISTFTCGGSGADVCRMGRIQFPTSLRQLKLEFDWQIYRLIPDMDQLTALTALSCRIDCFCWEEILPDSFPDTFPASLKLLEIENPDGAFLPPQITSICRLESLLLTSNGTSHSDFEYALDLGPLDIGPGKEEHDEWCRHLTYLGFSKRLFKELPKKLPPALVTIEFIYPDLLTAEDLDVCLTSHSSLHNLSQLRRLTFKPFHTYFVEQVNFLRGFKGLEVLDLRGDNKFISLENPTLILPRDIPTLHTLKHFGINFTMLCDHRYTGFFSVLTRLESLKLSLSEEYSDGESDNSDNSDDSDASESGSEMGEGLVQQGIVEEDSEGWIDNAVLDALRNCPNLKAIYSDNYRLRYMWNLPAEDGHETLYRGYLDRLLSCDIKETLLAITVRHGTVSLLPEEEWESVVGYGRQWTAWNQVE